MHIFLMRGPKGVPPRPSVYPSRSVKRQERLYAALFRVFHRTFHTWGKTRPFAELEVDTPQLSTGLEREPISLDLWKAPTQTRSTWGKRALPPRPKSRRLRRISDSLSQTALLPDERYKCAVQRSLFKKNDVDGQSPRASESIAKETGANNDLNRVIHSVHKHQSCVFHSIHRLSDILPSGFGWQGWKAGRGQRTGIDGQWVNILRTIG